MNTFAKRIAPMAAAVFLTGLVAPAALAQGLGVGADIHASVNAGGASSTIQARVQAHLTAAEQRTKDRANQEIARRIATLTKLSNRISQMSRLSASEQAVISGSVTDQISALNTLKAKIDADDSTTTLKADVQSIVDSYRIYMLVLPQAALMAAADRVNTIVTDMTELGAKLSDRITAAGQGGADISAAQTAFADYGAKVADAQSQVQAAQAEITGLVPDNGDKTIQQSNTAALKDARGKIQAAQKDLVAARQDITVVLKALPKQTGVNVRANANATSSTTVSQ
jgi:hypothetical protein